MPAIDITAVQPILKETYAPMLEIALYRNRPFLGQVKKTATALGTDRKVPLVIGGNTGLSADFATAQAQSAQPVYTAFAVTWFTYFGVVDVPGAQIRAGKSDQASFTDLLQMSLKMLFEQFSNRLALYLLGGDGTSQIGTISGISGATGTVPRAAVFGIEKGDTLVFCAPPVTTALRNGGTAATVLTIDRSTGNITVDAFPAGTVNGDFIFHKGDRAAGASPAQAVPSGWFAWIPVANPSATLFYGVDRTQDYVRCSGNRISAVGLGNNLQALMVGSNFAYENGGQPDTCFMSTATWNATVAAFNGNVRYIKEEAKGAQRVQFAYMGVEIMGQGGPIKCFLDPSIAQDGVAAIAQMDDWELIHNDGELIQPAKDAVGNGTITWWQRDAADTYEARLVFEGNLVCHNPGHQVTVTSMATT